MKNNDHLKILFIGRSSRLETLEKKISDDDINFLPCSDLSHGAEIILQQNISLVIIDSLYQDQFLAWDLFPNFQLPYLIFLSEADKAITPHLSEKLLYLSACPNSFEIINTINLALQRAQPSQEKPNTLTKLKSEALDVTTNGVTIVDKTDKIIYTNSAAAKIFGYPTSSELLGRSWKIFYTVKQLQLFELDIMKKLHKHGVWQGEIKGLQKDGTIFPLQLTLTIMKDDSIVAIFQDISQRLYDLKKLQDSEQKYRNLIDKMQLGLAIHRLILDEHMNPIDYQFLDLNPSYEKMTGLNHNETVGKRVKEILPELKYTWIERYANVVITGKPIEFIEYSKPLKKYFSIVAFKSGDMQFATIFADITQQQISEAELRQLKNNLQSKVDEQTEQLQEKIADLERFREATIQREFRINDLKQKIVELEAQLTE